MNAHRLAATLMEDGTLVLQGLPFQAGDTVEIIILEQPKADPILGRGEGSPSLPEAVRRDDEALLPLLDAEYLDAVAATLTEWTSEADERAYSHL